MRKTVAALLVAGAAVVVPAAAAEAALPFKFKNCTELQKKYPHGVGTKSAKDKTSGKPVTTFRKDTALYNKIVKHNKRLDRDKDKIACEKR